MGMPGKSRQIIVWVIVAEIVQKKKWIEILRLAETESAL